jgi:hypothetical protein
VKQATPVPGVFDSDFGSECDFEGGVGEIGAFEIGLEEGGHLCVAGTGVFEDEEVDPEGGHVDEEGKDDETENSCCPVTCIGALILTCDYEDDVPQAY